MCKKCGKGVNPTVFYKATVPEGTQSVVITQVFKSSKKFYRNPTTNNTYLIGGEVTEIEIFPEDVEWFLNLNKFGRYIFKINQEATEAINADLYVAKGAEYVSLDLQQGQEKEEEIQEEKELILDALTEVFPLVRRSETEELTFIVDESEMEKPKRGRKKKEE